MFLNPSPIVVNVGDLFAGFGWLTGEGRLYGDFEIRRCQGSRRRCEDGK
jgi:hypothetical protein